MDDQPSSRPANPGAALRAELEALTAAYAERQDDCRTGRRHLPRSVATAYHWAIEARRDRLQNPAARGDDET
jgi:hypothetical protein